MNSRDLVNDRETQGRQATSADVGNRPRADGRALNPYPVGSHYMPYWYPASAWSIVPPDRAPAIGFYDESRQATCDMQLGQMLGFGLDFVSIITFWNHDLGQPHADHWMRRYLTSTVTPKPKFSLMWDNTFTTTTPQGWRKMVDYWTANYTNRSDVVRYKGRPLVTVYVPEALKSAAGGTDAGIRGWLDAARQVGNFFILCSTLGGKHLSAGPGSAAAMGFDGVTTYNLVTGSNWDQMLAAYRTWWQAALTCPLPVLQPMSAGWDNSAQPGGVAISNPSSGQFEAGLRQALEFCDRDAARVIGCVVSSWNEHSEGSVMEPAPWIGGTARGLTLRRVFKGL